MPVPLVMDPDDPDLSGLTLGDFHLLRRLGEGGMGQVYLARQESLKREVALKVLRREWADSPVALKRFRAEAEAVARVTHPNIVQVYAVGHEGGRHFMALEYVEGRNLREFLARKGPPEWPLAVALLKQVASALERANEIGLVHRDIKPENVLLTRRGRVKVADFGLSRYFSDDGQTLSLTRTGVTVGTPLYMSPEQVQGKAVDHRSDLYSLGVTAYHLLAGHPPFRGATAFEVALQHVQDAPPPLAAARPDLPAGLAGLVDRLLAKDPAARYPSAREVVDDLTRIEKGELISGTLAPVVERGCAGSVPRRRRRWVAVAALALAVGAGAAVLGATGPARPRSTTGAGVPESRASVPVSEGLPAARLPEPVQSGRERELRAKLQARATKPEDYAPIAMDLGLLLVRERRLDAAESVFQDLAQERFAAGQKNTLARVGQAIVLAHRDQADKSVELLQELLTRTPRLTQQQLDGWWVNHPELGPALAEALERDAANLPAGKLPERLEWLRTPGGMARGR